MTEVWEDAEIFCVHGTSKDGFPFAAAGLCEAGTKARWEKAMTRFAGVPMNSASPYTVDLNLAASLDGYRNSSLLLVCAACCVDGPFPPDARTGGVIGEPGVDDASADGQEERTKSGARGIACPGGPGVFVGPRERPEALRRAVDGLAGMICGPTEAGITDALTRAGVRGPALVVFDGSGRSARGAVYARDGRGDVLCHVLPARPENVRGPENPL